VKVVGCRDWKIASAPRGGDVRTALEKKFRVFQNLSN
jgi:hypothetical protein